jgi:hypothetical protein
MAQYKVLMKVPMVSWPLLFTNLDTGRALCGAISRCNNRTQNSQVPSCPDCT